MPSVSVRSRYAIRCTSPGRGHAAPSCDRAATASAYCYAQGILGAPGSFAPFDDAAALALAEAAFAYVEPPDALNSG